MEETYSLIRVLEEEYFARHLDRGILYVADKDDDVLYEYISCGNVSLTDKFKELY